LECYYGFPGRDRRRLSFDVMLQLSDWNWLNSQLRPMVGRSLLAWKRSWKEEENDDETDVQQHGTAI